MSEKNVSDNADRRIFRGPGEPVRNSLLLEAGRSNRCFATVDSGRPFPFSPSDGFGEVRGFSVIDGPGFGNVSPLSKCSSFS